MFTSSETLVNQQFQNDELDTPGFMLHLMKSQGWTSTYTQRAIHNYKKFTFLKVVANHQAISSDQVEQKHAHTLLTQSYWEEFHFYHRISIGSSTAL